MKTSQAGIDLIKSFEGFEPEPYKDAGGLLTIGYGHLIKRGEQFTRITQEEGERLLSMDVRFAENCIEQQVEPELEQYEFDALVSFIYNLGCANFARSTLRKMINAENFANASNEFPKWNRVNGRIVRGLVRRRAAERTLFRGDSNA